MEEPAVGLYSASSFVNALPPASCMILMVYRVTVGFTQSSCYCRKVWARLWPSAFSNFLKMLFILVIKRTTNSKKNRGLKRGFVQWYLLPACSQGCYYALLYVRSFTSWLSCCLFHLTSRGERYPGDQILVLTLNLLWIIMTTDPHKHALHAHKNMLPHSKNRS